MVITEKSRTTVVFRIYEHELDEQENLTTQESRAFAWAMGLGGLAGGAFIALILDRGPWWWGANLVMVIALICFVVAVMKFLEAHTASKKLKRLQDRIRRESSTDYVGGT